MSNEGLERKIIENATVFTQTQPPETDDLYELAALPFSSERTIATSAAMRQQFEPGPDVAAEEIHRTA